MSARDIIDTFETWRARGLPLVLATVYRTAGSTYSKAGHRILINSEGDYRGLVSGGCLEGDLAEHARDVIATGRARGVTYDLRDGADELFGLGIGCNGLLAVFLQALTPENGYQPFAGIVECQLGDRGAALATVIASESPALPAGGSVLVRDASHEAWGLDAKSALALARGCGAALADGGAVLVAEQGSEIFYAPIEPLPRLLVLGAGLDAVPLVRMADELGWRVSVADHRPAYIARGGFERASEVALIEPDELATRFPLATFDAIVVMSHHLATDRRYLEQLARCTVPYLGVLGPRARRDRLLAELGAPGERLHGRLAGPVGLDIGADSPETIALSILAELQSRLSTSRRDGRRRTS